MTLWNDFFARVGLSWVMPRRVVNFLANWRGLDGNLQMATLWKMVPIRLWWCLWMVKNERSFEDHKWSMEELRILFFTSLFNSLFHC